MMKPTVKLKKALTRALHKGEPLKDDEAYCNVEKSFDKALI